MKYTVLLTPQADRELEEATDWWAEHRSREEASRWYAGISNAIRRLEENPDRWALSPETEEFPYELRELHFGLGSRPTHRALFTMINDIVIVLTVRHTARRSVTVAEIEFDADLHQDEPTSRDD